MSGRYYLTNEFDSFGRRLCIQACTAGDISARPCEAFDQPSSHHIPAECAHNGDLLRCLFGGGCGRCEPRHDHIDLELHQFRRQFRKAAHLSLVRSELEPNIFLVDVTELAERFREKLPELLPARSAAHQNADGGDFWLLRRGGTRPSRRAAKKRDEVPPLHLNPVGTDEDAGRIPVLSARHIGLLHRNGWMSAR